MHIGRDAGMSSEQLWELYYVLLLKDVGCSSNAARICELYLTDDRLFKHGAPVPRRHPRAAGALTRAVVRAGLMAAPVSLT